MLRACCGPVYCRAGNRPACCGPVYCRAGNRLACCGPPPPALAAIAASRRNTTSASLPLPLRAAPSCAGSHSSTPAEYHKRLTSVASAGRPRSCYTRQTATEQHRRPLRKQPGEAAALHTNTKGKSIQRFAFRRIYTLHLSQNLALTAKNSAPHRARNTNNAPGPPAFGKITPRTQSTVPLITLATQITPKPRKKHPRTQSTVPLITLAAP